MSRDFWVGSSQCRKAPPLSPQPEKSNANAVKPRSANARAYTSAICSLTVSHEPVTTTQRWRALSEAELRTKVPASGAPSLVKTIGSSYSMYPPCFRDDFRGQLIRVSRYGGQLILDTRSLCPPTL